MPSMRRMLELIEEIHTHVSDELWNDIAGIKDNIEMMSMQW